MFHNNGESYKMILNFMMFLILYKKNLAGKKCNRELNQMYLNIDKKMCHHQHS